MKTLSSICVVLLFVVSVQSAARRSGRPTSGKPRKGIHREPCSSPKNPCSNGGTCVPDAEAKHGYACLCADGFYGDLCTHRNEGCKGIECQNGGVCFGYNTGYTLSYVCICVLGFGGNHCELDFNECESNPCENGGTCSDGANDFSCICGPGWMGTRCQKPCTGDPALGMESREIPDSSITSNKYKQGADFDRLPHFGRLNNVRYWAAYISQKPWLQVDLLEPTFTYGIQTQGDRGENGAYTYWITKLSVQTGLTVDSLTNVVSTNGTEIFDANTGPDSTATLYWPMPIETRFVRVYPQECKRDGRPGTCVLKLEILGDGC